MPKIVQLVAAKAADETHGGIDTDLYALCDNGEILVLSCPSQYCDPGHWMRIPQPDWEALGMAEVSGQPLKKNQPAENWPAEVDDTRKFQAWARDNGLEDSRALKAIARAGMASLSMISAHRLKGTYNCGPGTIAKIMAWRDSQLSRKSQG